MQSQMPFAIASPCGHHGVSAPTANAALMPTCRVHYALELQYRSREAFDILDKGVSADEFDIIIQSILATSVIYMILACSMFGVMLWAINDQARIDIEGMPAGIPGTCETQFTCCNMQCCSTATPLEAAGALCISRAAQSLDCLHAIHGQL